MQEALFSRLLSELERVPLDDGPASINVARSPRVHGRGWLMKRALVVLSSLIVVAACGSPAATTTTPSSTSSAVGAGDLKAPAAFDRITPKEERSRALFIEATRVMLHPRCVNCHPAGDSPLQGDQGKVHDPPVTRGAEDNGVVGMECSSCHQDKNVELARVPGAPKWHLAPKAMAWVGRTPSSLCEQLKDPKRNGGKTVAQIVDHTGHDELVAWGWSPGHGRVSAPGSQATFGALMAAWAETGAVCPR
jgi:hypothetical protein